MEGQDAVNTTPEQTDGTESAPVEQETADASQAPVDESNQPKKVSESVPYERFKEVNGRLKELEDIVAKSQAPTNPSTSERLENNMPELDPDSARAVEAIVEQRIEAYRAAEFARKHADELKDPILYSRVAGIIRESNAKNQAIDQEEALSQAKKEIEARLAPQVKDAKSEGFTEGQEIAQQKQKLGAVGDVNKVSPKVDPSQLSAKEYAEYFGLPRAN